jgi:hypothetical protein
MFPGAYGQVIRGEFIEIEYTLSVVNVYTLITGYSIRVEEQVSGTSCTHVL